MAQYRATIKGRRGQASRLGDKRSGIISRTAGWDVGVEVEGRFFLGEHGPRGGRRHAEETGHDRFDISVDNGNGYKDHHSLYLGSVECDKATGRPLFTPSREAVPDLSEFRAMTAMVALLLAAQAPKSQGLDSYARDASAVEIERVRQEV